jgi:hypothetical protein
MRDGPECAILLRAYCEQMVTDAENGVEAEGWTKYGHHDWYHSSGTRARILHPAFATPAPTAPRPARLTPAERTAARVTRQAATKVQELEQEKDKVGSKAVCATHVLHLLKVGQNGEVKECGFGKKCKFNHPRAMGEVIQGQADSALRAGFIAKDAKLASAAATALSKVTLRSAAADPSPCRERGARGRGRASAK